MELGGRTPINHDLHHNDLKSRWFFSPVFVTEVGELFMYDKDGCFAFHNYHNTAHRERCSYCFCDYCMYDIKGLRMVCAK